MILGTQRGEWMEVALSGGDLPCYVGRSCFTSGRTCFVSSCNAEVLVGSVARAPGGAGCNEQGPEVIVSSRTA